MNRVPWTFRVVLLFLPACAGTTGALVSPSPDTAAVATFLHINDTYRIEGSDGGTVGGLARVRGLRLELERAAPDLVVTHAGDMLGPSFLSRTYKGAQMLDVLGFLDGDATRMDDRLLVTFGNHEFDSGSMSAGTQLDAKVETSGFRWLDSNITWAEGPDGQSVVAAPNLKEAVVMEVGGLKVGFFSLTTDSAKPEFIDRFGDFEDVARASCAVLRRDGAQAVVALTHLTMAQDVALLRELGPAGPDLILGGHDHVQSTEDVDGRLVVKAHADALSAAVVHLSIVAGRPKATVEFRPLRGPELIDAETDTRVQGWLERHAREYCAEIQALEGCLDEVYTRTRVRLVGEEERFRRYETNLGDWLADQARAAFPGGAAQIALLNSGAFRLNRDLAVGEPLTRQTVEELFGFPVPLRLLRVPGSVVRRMLERSIQEWSSSGHWLQVSGLAFRHDPLAGTVSDVAILDREGPRPLRDEDEISLVVGQYLLDKAGDQDGYTMLDPGKVIAEGPDLRDVVQAALRAAGETGLSPALEGRICNSGKAGPCLALGGQGP